MPAFQPVQLLVFDIAKEPAGALRRPALKERPLHPNRLHRNTFALVLLGTANIDALGIGEPGHRGVEVISRLQQCLHLDRARLTGNEVKGPEQLGAAAFLAGVDNRQDQGVRGMEGVGHPLDAVDPRGADMEPAVIGLQDMLLVHEHSDVILEFPGDTSTSPQLPVMPHVDIAGVPVVNHLGLNLRTAAKIDGRVDGVVSRIEVAADMERGDSLPGAHRVKTAGVAFGGQDLGEILPNEKQIAHRVLVFEARQAAGRNTTLPTLPGEVLFEKIAFQRIERLRAEPG